jgi:hypothetical protein
MSIGWWIRQIGLILLGSFFLMFGIQLLVAAYRLADPMTFIFTFFASNFVILISATLIVGFVYRVITAVKHSRLRE